MPVRHSPAFRSHRAARAVLTAVWLVTVVAGCAPAQTADPADTAQVSGTPPLSTAATAATPAIANASTCLVLRFDGHVATGILDDTPVARRFAAMLPLTLHLSDPMGQAKSGPLPRFRSLDVTHADRTLRIRAGELAFWSPGSTVAIVYDDLGQHVPPPGLVHLGLIDAGLRDIAAAGNNFTVHIDLAPEAGRILSRRQLSRSRS